ncbi:MAG TPA: serine/threonine protein kinase, partial [Nannocystis exedens]|nr:serine/threonine protein kinase [Nannocystis exedens]
MRGAKARKRRRGRDGAMDLTLLARERVGKVLRGKYHLDRLIDVGGMAAVYEATHRNGTRSAIKVLHPKYVSDVQARTRFLREGYAANHVGHPGSVTVLDDDFTEEGDVYLVMELLDGESLESCICREKQMNEIDVLSIADQLLDVLSSAHHKDIIHRDIKPANIMLTRSGIVKLLDFGLARVRELPAVAGVHSAEIVFGTVAYVSPEAARANNDEMDGRADLWAVAATMFKALAGETVHGMDGSVMERLIRAARNQARSLGDVMPHLHPRVIDVVDRALMFHPDDRWPSAAVMQAIVQDVLAQLMEERAVPPSLFFMPGLSQVAVGYTASGPMSSMSATATPTPRPYLGQVATPSPSPYPHPGLPAQPVNPLNQVARHPLNQVRGRPVRQQPQPQPQPQPGYVNPLNQIASRRQVQPAPQPRVQRQPVNPLNQIAAPSGRQWRSQNEPQNRGPASYAQVARGQNHAPTSSDSSFEIDIDDLDGGADLSHNALDVTITIEEDVPRKPEKPPRRATTMRDLGSAAARAR